MLTNKLIENIGTPFHAQMTVDSVWEEAIGSDLSDSSIKDMVDTMAQKSGKLALEVTYKLDSGRNMYFGLKQDSSLARASTPQLFLGKLVSLLPKIATVNFVDGVKLMGTELNADDKTFLQQPPHELELGVYNNWNSAGPCNIWQAGEAMPTQETFTTKLKGHDVLMRNSLNYIGLEHIFDNPVEHWLSIEVSNTENGQYTLDQQFALEIAQLTFI
jgi:hypothetical protein